MPTIFDNINQNLLPRLRQMLMATAVAKIFEDVPGYARVVRLADIAANDWNLNIPRYIEPVIEEETIIVAEAMDNLQTALTDAYAAEDKLKTLLQESGLMK
jgi:type I restriction enzyme M protein